MAKNSSARAVLQNLVHIYCATHSNGTNTGYGVVLMHPFSGFEAEYQGAIVRNIDAPALAIIQTLQMLKRPCRVYLWTEMYANSMRHKSTKDQYARLAQKHQIKMFSLQGVKEHTYLNKIHMYALSAFTKSIERGEFGPELIE